MKKVKLITLLFSIFLLTGCSQYVTILEANKTMNVSGLSRGKDYIDYSLTIDVLKDISFKGVQLNKREIKESLFLKDLSTGLSTTKIKPSLTKGKYLFGFRSFTTNNEKEKDTITLLFKVDNKLFTLEKEVIVKSKKINR